MLIVDIDAIILNVADVASVVRDSFRYCQMLAALASCNEEEDDENDDENENLVLGLSWRVARCDNCRFHTHYEL